MDLYKSKSLIRDMVAHAERFGTVQNNVNTNLIALIYGSIACSMPFDPILSSVVYSIANFYD